MLFNGDVVCTGYRVVGPTLTFQQRVSFIFELSFRPEPGIVDRFPAQVGAARLFRGSAEDQESASVEVRPFRKLKQKRWCAIRQRLCVALLGEPCRAHTPCSACRNCHPKELSGCAGWCGHQQLMMSVTSHTLTPPEGDQCTCFPPPKSEKGPSLNHWRMGAYWSSACMAGATGAEPCAS